MDRFDKKWSRSVHHIRLYTVTILADVISSIAVNYGVNCHQIILRLNSALMFTVTAMAEGLFAPHEDCFCLCGAFIIVLHSFLAQNFETLIVYIFSFQVETSLWPS
jgi:hypothetical protein